MAKKSYSDNANYNKHMSLDLKSRIQDIITRHRNPNGSLSITLKDMADILQKDPSSISKLVKNNRFRKERHDYAAIQSKNCICKHYDSCTITKPYTYNGAKSTSFKKNYYACWTICDKYEENICSYLTSFPWVCNGCPLHNSCKLNKYFFDAVLAHKEYRINLSERRQGIDITKNELDNINSILLTSLREKRQPIYHIIQNHKDEFPVSERTIYNYIKNGALLVGPLDTRRMVKMKKRDKKKQNAQILRKNKVGRTYEDYQQFVLNNPEFFIIQMDCVMGSNSKTDEDNQPTLLTLHFVNCGFQIAVLMKEHTSECVVKALDYLEQIIGLEDFKSIFGVILTDNGSEFSNIHRMENNEYGEPRTKVFFCHPYSSYEKPECERNHEYIRYVLPKGTSFDNLTQDKVNLMMSHINSASRPRFKTTPYNLISTIYGEELLKKIGINKIDPDDVCLSPKLIK